MSDPLALCSHGCLPPECRTCNPPLDIEAIRSRAAVDLFELSLGDVVAWADAAQDDLRALLAEVVGLRGGR